jgi:SAM-dependent methyltransferase
MENDEAARTTAHRLDASRGGSEREGESLRRRVASLFPYRLQNYLRRHFSPSRNLLPVGGAAWGDLRRTEPISRDFGFERGGPVDRYYIENFLAANAGDVQGAVLEVKDAEYTRRYGGKRVSRSDVLDIDPDNKDATIIADLNDARSLPDDAYDCIILTQVLMLVYDVRAALRELHRSLKPGGVLLVTVGGITPIDYDGLGDTWYWSFSRAAMLRLMREHFPHEAVEVEAHGNVLAATAFLQGLSYKELTRRELDLKDPMFQINVTARAVKPS